MRVYLIFFKNSYIATDLLQYKKFVDLIDYNVNLFEQGDTVDRSKKDEELKWKHKQK